VAVAWLTVALLAYTGFAAGMALFGTPPDFQPHRDAGWTVHLAPLLLIIVAAFARVGAPTLWWNAALLVAVGVQPFLPGLRTSAPLLAALHPANAMLIFFLAVTIAWQSRAFWSEPSTTPASGS
jgi:hypothetical protein